MNRKESIEQLMKESLNPEVLIVEDESNLHHVPLGAQTHFKVIAVSSKFEHLKRVDRHKMLNKLLEKEFETGLHAISMHLYTKEEWQQQKTTVLKSPACKDGYKNN